MPAGGSVVLALLLIAAAQAPQAGDGTYVFRDIPPGEYQIAAVDDVEQGQWTDPAYLQSLVPSATKVTVAEGEKKTLDVRAGGG